MKKTAAVALFIIASILAAQAETQTVEGLLERSMGGSKSFVLKNPSVSVMNSVIFTDPQIQAELTEYEGKKVIITGDFYKRPAGYSAIKSIDKIEVLGE